MDSPWVPDSVYWLKLLLMTAAASSVLVALAALLERLIRGAIWQRAIWQAAVAALAVLALGQWLGFGQAAVGLFRLAVAPAAEQGAEAAPVAAAVVGDLPAGELEAAASVDRVASDGITWPAYLWGFGTAFVLLQIARTQWSLMEFRRHHTVAADGECLRPLEKLAQGLQIRRPVAFLQSPGLRAPVAFGWLRPTLVFVSVITTVGLFQIFAEPYVMTRGGPLNATTTIALLMYQQGFRWWNMGRASAIAFVLFALILAVSALQALWRRRSPA